MRAESRTFTLPWKSDTGKQWKLVIETKVENLRRLVYLHSTVQVCQSGLGKEGFGLDFVLVGPEKAPKFRNFRGKDWVSRGVFFLAWLAYLLFRKWGLIFRSWINLVFASRKIVLNRSEKISLDGIIFLALFFKFLCPALMQFVITVTNACNFTSALDTCNFFDRFFWVKKGGGRGKSLLLRLVGRLSSKIIKMAGF